MPMGAGMIVENGDVRFKPALGFDKSTGKSWTEINEKDANRFMNCINKVAGKVRPLGRRRGN